MCIPDHFATSARYSFQTRTSFPPRHARCCDHHSANPRKNYSEQRHWLHEYRSASWPPRLALLQTRKTIPSQISTCFRSASHRPKSRTVAVGPQASGLRMSRELLKSEQMSHQNRHRSLLQRAAAVIEFPVTASHSQTDPSPGNLRLSSQRFQEGNQRISLLSAQFYKTSRGIECFAIVTRDSIFER